jgi:hypothetical protein
MKEGTNQRKCRKERIMEGRKERKKVKRENEKIKP